RERHIPGRYQGQRGLEPDRVIWSEQLSTTRVGAALKERVERPKRRVRAASIAARRVDDKSDARVTRDGRQGPRALRHDSPRTNVSRAESAELIDRLGIVRPRTRAPDADT